MDTQILKFITILLILSGNFSLCEGKEPKSKQDLISSNLLKTGSVEPALLVGEWNFIMFAYTDDGENISNQAVIPIDSVYYDIERIASYHGISIDSAINRVRPWLKIPNPPITFPENEWKTEHEALFWYLPIPPANRNSGHGPLSWRLHACNTSLWSCSLSGNLIKLKAHDSTAKECSKSIAKDIRFALLNAYSFVIRDDEFIIFFTGVKKFYENFYTIQEKKFKILENHNLLILKRRT